MCRGCQGQPCDGDGGHFPGLLDALGLLGDAAWVLDIRMLPSGVGLLCVFAGDGLAYSHEGVVA